MNAVSYLFDPQPDLDWMLGNSTLSNSQAEWACRLQLKPPATTAQQQRRITASRRAHAYPLDHRPTPLRVRSVVGTRTQDRQQREDGGDRTPLRSTNNNTSRNTNLIVDDRLYYNDNNDTRFPFPTPSHPLLYSHNHTHYIRIWINRVTPQCPPPPKSISTHFLPPHFSSSKPLVFSLFCHQTCLSDSLPTNPLAPPPTPPPTPLSLFSVFGFSNGL